MLNREIVAGRRLVIQRNGRESGYKHLLRLPWGSAKTIENLGCTLYYLLAGSPPFQYADALMVLYAHQHETPQPLTQSRHDFPPALGQVVDKMLAKDPAQRYQTPADVARDLAHFLPNAPAMNSMGDVVENARTAAEEEIATTDELPAEQIEKAASPEEAEAAMDRAIDLQSRRRFPEAKTEFRKTAQFAGDEPLIRSYKAARLVFILHGPTCDWFEADRLENDASLGPSVAIVSEDPKFFVEVSNGLKPYRNLSLFSANGNWGCAEGAERHWRDLCIFHSLNCIPVYSGVLPEADDVKVLNSEEVALPHLSEASASGWERELPDVRKMLLRLLHPDPRAASSELSSFASRTKNLAEKVEAEYEWRLLFSVLSFSYDFEEKTLLAISLKDKWPPPGSTPRKLWVGGLSYSFSDIDLHQMFSAYGKVRSANVKTGFGYVELSTAEEGRAAIQALNGKATSGRILSVKENTWPRTGPRDFGLVRRVSRPAWHGYGRY